MFTVLFAYVVFFLLVLWLGICVEVDVERITFLPPPPPPPPHFFFQAEDGIRDRSPSRGLGDVYKRQLLHKSLAIKRAKKKRHKQTTQ